MKLRIIVVSIVLFFSFFTYFYIQGSQYLNKKSFSDSYAAGGADLAELELILSVKDLNPSEFNLMSRKFFYDENFIFTIRTLERFIKLYPSQINSETYSILAESSYELEKTFSNEVLNYIDKSLYIDPSNTKALSLKGLFFYEKNSFNEALKTWAIALDNSKDNNEKESLIIAMNLALKKLENTK